MKFINNLKLKQRILILVSSLLILMYTVLGIFIYINQRNSMIKACDVQMTNQVNDIYNLLELNKNERDLRIKNSFLYAKESFYSCGNIIEDSSTITVDATEQISKITEKIDLKKWFVNGKTLHENFEVVDKIKSNTDVSATLFQRIPSGYIRISTNVLKSDGQRAVYTYISNSSKVAKTISEGKTYQGRAFVVNDWYSTIYEPIIINGEVKGMLFVGIQEKDMTYLKEKLKQISFFESGYVYLVSGNGDIWLHPFSEGQNMATADIFKQMKEKPEGRLEYVSINSGKDKIQYYKYFEPYDCFIIATVDKADITSKPLAGMRNILIIAIILSIIILSLAINSIINTFTNPINSLVLKIKDLAKGKLVNKIEYNRKDEISLIINSLNELVEGLRRTSQFSNEIEKGNFTAEFQPLSNEDVLGKSLIDMRDSLHKAAIDEEKRKKEDDKRNWTTQGIAQFSEILRQNNDKLNILSFSIIKSLVKYLKANQGGIFIYNEENHNDLHLELTACYAYERQKFIDKKVMLGEGIVGSCFLEKKTSYITNIPQNYIEIKSGLGGENPKALLIVPLKLNNIVYGVVEIASFHFFEPHEIEFVEKIGESIASTLSTVKINVKTAVLLEKSQLQAEQMRSQEEEMRQNMEELTATQEEMERKNIEMEGVMAALNAANYIIEYDKNGRIININDGYLKFLHKTREQILGTHHKDNIIMNEEQDREYKKFWDDLLNGKTKKITNQIIIDNLNYWVTEAYTPIIDRNGTVLKILKIAIDITENKVKEQQLIEQTQIMKTQEEELRQNLEEMQAIQEELVQKDVRLKNVAEEMSVAEKKLKENIEKIKKDK